MNIADPTICQWDTARFLILSDNVFGNFIYYSHIFPAVTALLLGFFVFFHNPRKLQNQLLLALSVTFSVWIYFDLILWASERSDLIIFFWSILIYFDLLLYVISFYLIYSFVRGDWPSWRWDAFFATLFLPLFLFAHTPLNLIAFDFTNCWREAIEGPLWQSYVYIVEALVLGLVVYVGYLGYTTHRGSNRAGEILFISTGIVLFLLTFLLGNLAGSLAIDWELGQYGLFGMPIFIGMIGYAIIKYNSFNVKILSANLLVAGLFVSLTSLLFVRTIENVRVITVVTLILLLVLGTLLIHGVRREVTQKEEIEKLIGGLARANRRLKLVDKQKSEFVSIASHQLRSPLTAIRGYASMILEGSFGAVPNKLRKPLEHIEESSRLMALSIEDYLNVSRIESGNMKYDFSDFNLRDEVERITDDLRPEALKQGLLLLFRSDLDAKAIVHADKGKVHQIVHNLINNALKYTRKGHVTVFIHDNAQNKKIYVEVIDTGIGMNQDTIDKLFQKFERSENAATVNVHGTGLGLYVAKRMAESMHGNVTAFSEGESKGSRFIFEIPFVM